MILIQYPCFLSLIDFGRGSSTLYPAIFFAMSPGLTHGAVIHTVKKNKANPLPANE